MSYSLVPVNLKPHLVAFLFEHFEGKEETYLGKKVKSARIDTRSSLGRYIRMMCVKTGKPEPASKYNFFLSVKSVEDSKKFKGTLFRFHRGKCSWLMLPPEFNEDLNELLQDLFESSLFYYVEGYRVNGGYGAFRKGLRDFIDQYNLYECGYTFGALEQMYMRTKKRKETLVNFQRRSK